LYRVKKIDQWMLTASSKS